MTSEPAGPHPLDRLSRDAAEEFAPALRRVLDLDRAALARVRLRDGTAQLLLRLPFGVVVGRSVSNSGASNIGASNIAVSNSGASDSGASDGGVPTADASAATLDVTVSAADLFEWASRPGVVAPESRDELWTGGAPPAAGWARIERVPDAVIRDLVRSGALALKQAAEREGVRGAQPRAEVADALLDSVVLRVSAEGSSATPAGPVVPLSLRAVSAVTRMGFLPRGSYVNVDVAGRWIRIAAAYGSVFVERPGLALDVLRR